MKWFNRQSLPSKTHEKFTYAFSAPPALSQQILSFLRANGLSSPQLGSLRCLCSPSFFSSDLVPSKANISNPLLLHFLHWRNSSLLVQRLLPASSTSSPGWLEEIQSVNMQKSPPFKNKKESKTETEQNPL